MIRVPNLLSPNDFKYLSKSFSSMQEVTLIRTLSNYSITVSTSPTGKAISVWNQPFIFQVREEQGNIISLKNCRDIDELKSYLYSVAKERDVI